jgi:uncharacterized membrane protein YjjP (DUF1212 family)
MTKKFLNGTIDLKNDTFRIIDRRGKNMKRIDDRKRIVIRLNEEELNMLEKAKTKENLPMKDSDMVKLLVLRYLGGNV